MYSSLWECILDLEKHGHLVRIKEEIDPDLEMAAVHLRISEMKGPALFFENLKGCKYKAASNLFGTLERSQFIFRDSLASVKTFINAKTDPLSLFKNPLKGISTGISAINALPKKSSSKFHFIHLSDLPQIKCWPDDGGAFITLPQVYTEDMDKPGVMNSNLGMYRIQISGNDYKKDTEAGLHYQLHRGIGVHQYKSNKKGEPLRVSIFVGGPPAHTLAAVMPLPEGVPEVAFAGVLGKKRFRYFYHDGFMISSDADFVICGEVYPGELKQEGPFGDHLGYYSLKHDFPLLRVKHVLARENAIWPFTVVGRPPQEDTAFGAIIHELAGGALQSEIPGLISLNAVDAAGVHPLLLAKGKERYTPYYDDLQPQEILTISNRILGTGQLSLAKYLFITADADVPSPDPHHIEEFFGYILERIDPKRDLHFHTNTSIDTLDYSGTGLNAGSKVVIAICDKKRRVLSSSLSSAIDINGIHSMAIVLPGILGIEIGDYTDKFREDKKIEMIAEEINNKYPDLSSQFPLIIITEQPQYISEHLNNFLWMTFTRSNPSHDIHGVGSFIESKHWGCKGSIIIDARKKPHHAPELVKNEKVEQVVDRIISGIKK